jgi:polo-like kinase 1
MSRLSRRSDEESRVIIEERVSKSSGAKETKRYSKGNFLGKGGFARVYEMTDLETNKVLAGKIVSKESLSKSRAKQKLMSEIKIHRSLSHPNIVGFERCFEDDENVYILLEICTNQTMSELVRRRKRLTEIEVQCYLLQLLDAVKYLHTHKVIHRDLKLGNLFLTNEMQIKIGDFGLATKVEYPGERKRTICGTPNYIAPEVLEGQAGHSYEADVWSIGVIAFTLLVGKPPFETADVKTTYRRIRMNAYSFPDNIPLSDAVKSLVSSVLLLDPTMRPSIDDLLAHEFFHQGNTIPKLLPASTIACPPAASYLRQFMPSAKATKRPMRLTESQPSLTRATKRFGSTRDLLNFDKGSRLDELKRLPSKEATKPEARKSDSPKLGRLLGDYKASPRTTARTGLEVWVVKWVDYSSKYGLGYLLSSGATGVFFNDSTMILLAPSGARFDYIVRQGGTDTQELTSTHSITDFPKELQKKVTLLNHFKVYLEAEGAPTTPSTDPTQLAVYVKKWRLTRHAMMFRFSNKVVQVVFQDKSEVILSSETKMVTYVDRRSNRNTYLLDQAMESENHEMTKRLKYTKDILTHMLSTAGHVGSQR